MIYFENKNYESAIREVRMGISIIGKDKMLTDHKIKFLNLMKFYLSKYLYLNGNYGESTILLNEIFIYNNKHEKHLNNIPICDVMYKI